MIVMKFGGTSNEDAVAMRNVLRIVRGHLQHRPVVVISAVARATNELEQTARTAAEGREEEARGIVNALFDRHTRIIDNLITGRSVAAELETVLYAYLQEIHALVKGISILRELTPRSMDAICSYGERLSSRIIAAGLREEGVDAVWVDARDVMITDDNFGRAQPIMDLVTRALDMKIRPILEAGKTPVTQGFIGATTGGASTTMGRESSDYSASIIGAAMHAERVQIWTDVDGLLTADPRVVPDTLKINRISFEEAFELSYFGAKVLHPATMLPVLEKSIPVQILNSKRAAGTGTWVDAAGAQGDDVAVMSIAARVGLTVLTVTPRRRFNQFLFWEGVFSTLDRHGVTTALMTTSEFRLAAAVNTRDLRPALLHELGEIGDTAVREGMASICVVGRGLRGRAGVSERLFRALHSARCHMISSGASASSLTVVVEEQEIPSALERLHAEFFDALRDHAGFERHPAA
jgi:aspartate kinase